MKAKMLTSDNVLRFLSPLRNSFENILGHIKSPKPNISP